MCWLAFLNLTLLVLAYKTSGLTLTNLQAMQSKGLYNLTYAPFPLCEDTFLEQNTAERKSAPGKEHMLLLC